MAMTKAERAEMARLQQELAKKDKDIALAQALRWPTDLEPKQFSVEEIREIVGKPGGSPVVAHYVHTYSAEWRTSLGWTTGYRYSEQEDSKHGNYGCGRFYRSRLEALLAIRHDVARYCAGRLAAIDAEIEGERAAGEKGETNG